MLHGFHDDRLMPLKKLLHTWICKQLHWLEVYFCGLAWQGKDGRL